MEALPLFLDDVDMLPICRLRQVAIKVSSMARNADCSRTLQNHFSVLIWSSCAKAPVSQLVEETASKSVQCGFESHRGHRIDKQPWLEISSTAFSLKPIWRMCRYVGAQYLAIRQIVGYLHVPATPVKTDAHPMLFCLLMFD